MPRPPLSAEQLRAFYFPAINIDSTLCSITNQKPFSASRILDLTPSQSQGILDQQVLPSSEGSDRSNRRQLDRPSDVDGYVSSKLTTVLQKSALVAKNYSCQRCLLQGLYCNQQRPSCWICQKYCFPCWYEHEGGDNTTNNDLRVSFDDISEYDSPSWEESLKENPYQNLERRTSLWRIVRRTQKPRYSQLAKQHPQRFLQKTLSTDWENMKAEEVGLLASPPLTASDLSTPPRTPSPLASAPSSSHPPLSRPNSSCGSSYMSSGTPFESIPTTSTRHYPSTAKTTPPPRRGSCMHSATEMETAWRHAPRPFQCTFCLQQCDDIDDWEDHEISEHIPDKIWVCMPWGPVQEIGANGVCVFCGLEDPDEDHDEVHNVEACYCNENAQSAFSSEVALFHHLSRVHGQKVETPAMASWSRFTENEYYWNCGFCEEVMSRWSDRVDHIGTHFEAGMVMSLWDPLKPSYPLNRSTLSCVGWFPPLDWDFRQLWELERNRVGFSWVLQLFRCRHCDIDIRFRDEADLNRHEYIWHTRREVWACPTIREIRSSLLASQLFPIDSSESYLEDTCCFCKKDFGGYVGSFSGAHAWDLRLGHLKSHHGFGSCQPVFRSSRACDVLLHLANEHNVCLSGMTADVLEACRKEERPLAKRCSRRSDPLRSL
ncbi:hypothetical protein B0J14DRAFT_204714 [Halenospora varia]|nr:hypothetical protein B0J14DRAFT_204714 [Halenospora varia]